MLASGRSPAEVAEELRAVAENAVARREIRVLYLHPRAIAAYPRIWRALIEDLDEQRKSGRLTVAAMTDYASFLDRAGRVRIVVRRSGSGLAIKADSPASLEGITLALPVTTGHAVLWTDGPYRQSFDTSGPSGNWLYLTVEGDTNSFAALTGPTAAVRE